MYHKNVLASRAALAGVPQKTAGVVLFFVSHLHEVGDEGDRLDSLAQTHLVREDTVEVVVVQRDLPTKKDTAERRKKKNVSHVEPNRTPAKKRKPRETSGNLLGKPR